MRIVCTREDEASVNRVASDLIRDHERRGGALSKIDEQRDTVNPISSYPDVDKTDTLEIIEAELAVLVNEHASDAMATAVNIQQSSAKSVDNKDSSRNEFMIRLVDYGRLVHVVCCF